LLKISLPKKFIRQDRLDFITQIDSSRKFSGYIDNACCDLVQQQNFKILLGFWSPVSGLQEKE